MLLNDRSLSIRHTALSALTFAVALVAVPSLAFGQPKDGTYKGMSTGKIQVRVADPVLGVDFKTQTDTGKASFKIKRGAVKSLSVTGQQAMCGGQPVDVDIKLSSLLMGLGGGAAIYTHPTFGPQKVSVTFGPQNSATGQIRYGGLCARAKATFSVKLS